MFLFYCKGFFFYLEVSYCLLYVIYVFNFIIKIGYLSNLSRKYCFFEEFLNVNLGYIYSFNFKGKINNSYVFCLIKLCVIEN